MASASAPGKKIPVTPLVVSAVCVIVLIVGAAYLSRPTPTPAQDTPATAEAKAYLPNLQLSNVTMQATENFMKQQVVEVQGKITNNGPRPLALVEVYCLFYGVDGREIHRERLPVVRSGGGLSPLGSSETRPFRLPFDNLPEGWNQALPKLVIARITFSS